MKVKMFKDKKTGETRIDYYKALPYETFRWEILKKVLTNQALILSIDTNLVKSNKDQQETALFFESALTADHMLYEVVPVECTKDKKIFGISMKTSDKKAFNILISMNASEITKDFFDKYLSDCDVMIGINPKKSFEETVKDVQKGYLNSFFDERYFENTLYNSTLICSMRLTKGIDTSLL